MCKSWYVSNPVAKTLSLDWKAWLAQLFCMSSWGSPLLDPKKASKRTVLHNHHWSKEKDSWSMLTRSLASLLPWWLCMYYWRFWEPFLGPNAMGEQSCCQNSGLDWKAWLCTTVFACLPGAHPYWTQKSFKTNSFGIIGLIREKTPVDGCPKLAPIAAMMIMMAAIGASFGNIWAGCYVSNPYCQNSGYVLKSWLAQLFLQVFLGLTLTVSPKKTCKTNSCTSNRLNKDPNSWVDVANLAPCCHDALWCTIGGFGKPPMGTCYVSNPVAARSSGLDWTIKTGTTVFACLQWGSPLLDQKSFKTKQFYIIDWIRKKLPGRHCQNWLLAASDDYECKLLEVLGTLDC